MCERKKKRMIYYTADPHFGYERVIRKTGRPFSTVEEMDQTLIENWNRKIGADDTVYLLGDVGGHDAPFPARQVAALNGHKHLIRGNHDTALPNQQQLLEYFETVTDFWELKDNGIHIVLSHYPMIYSQGGYMIHGHLHNAQREGYEILKSLPRVLNAGVDVNGFCPVTLEELIQNNRVFYNDPERGVDLCRKLDEKCRKKHGWKADFHPLP